MTINELITYLNKCKNKDTIVSIDGYEGGVTDKINIQLIKVIPGTVDAKYSGLFGEHEQDDNGTEHRLLLGRH